MSALSRELIPALSGVTCGKIPFRTRRAACAQARYLNRTLFPGFRGDFMAAYWCPVCSGEVAVWHVTRQEQIRRGGEN